MNARLISKYGRPVTVNTQNTKAYIEDKKRTYYTASRSPITSFLTHRIHTFVELDYESIIVIDGVTHRVLDISDVLTANRHSYADAVVYEDDFTNDVTVFAETIETTNCNLPKKGTEIGDFKARIKAVKASDYLENALSGQTVITHTFLLRVAENQNDILSITKANGLEWGNRKFEILAVDNLNEKNVFLLLNCIEVLA